MWQAFAAILVLVMLAAIAGIVIGLIVGIVRKAWTILKYSGATFGAAFLLFLVVAVANPGGSFETSASENATSEALNPSATPEPTSTPEPPPVPDIIERGELHPNHWFEAHERCDISKAQLWSADTYDDIVTSRLSMSVVFETVLGGEDEYLHTG